MPLCAPFGPPPRAPWKRHTRQPRTAGARRRSPVRLEVAEQRGLECICRFRQRAGRYLMLLAGLHPGCGDGPHGAFEVDLGPGNVTHFAAACGRQYEEFGRPKADAVAGSEGLP